LPNINELLLATKATPKWLRPIHFLLLLKTRKLRTGRQLVYGISPRFRDRSLHGWMSYEHFLHAKALFDHAMLGWIEESNTEVTELASLLGGVRSQTWCIYQRELVRGSATQGG